jgi:hypothetical protein
MDIDPLHPATSKRRHRWFQFSLRTLFVAVTIVAVACAFAAPMIQRWWRFDDSESEANEQNHWLLDHSDKLLEIRYERLEDSQPANVEATDRSATH